MTATEATIGEFFTFMLYQIKAQQFYTDLVLNQQC